MHNYCPTFRRISSALVGIPVWMQPPFYCDYGSNIRAARLLDEVSERLRVDTTMIYTRPL